MTLPDRMKYRAWHKPTQQMFEVYAFSKDWAEVKVLPTHIKPAQLVKFGVLPQKASINCRLPLSECELMQCTGHFVNDKLVYESDICKCNHYDYIFYAAIYWSEDELSWHFDDSFDEDSCIKVTDVVGNIYQHKHLLEGNK